jgi:transcriptional regulator with XRE-family HTH domain
MPFVKQENGELEYQPMSGRKLHDARMAFGMKRIEFGQMLGMTGENKNIYATIRRYEEGLREISPMVERLVKMLLWHKEDFGYLPDLDGEDRVPTKMPEDFTA